MLRRISESGHRVGSAYALTTFARVQDGRADELEAYLGALPVGPDSPFARIDTLHIARVQLFRALVHQGPDQTKRDELQHTHLVFTSTIDGDLEPYVEALRKRVPECDQWWGRCVGYPGRTQAGAFLGWVRSIQARPGLFRSALPNATVHEVRHALALRERVIDFAVEAQGLSAAELHERFKGEFRPGGLDSLEEPARGAPSSAAARARR
ncbi:hypothetical protein DVA67_023585 [Solirubrobacter sp. CPCC 204708]|uniref:Uncharacterized protein n=1 Tax=Solirubrobacter deserti TaxID=2282478 RepID=A0ABT4RL93_9ACTN|nr:hypothetical protein [Solirubrobacter deserti]MBE2318976.1 hypothetical protein [Solirubrobacter deserti]MDA0139299.1 hypothetical protein [Solirubrobacter deserti]